ncbi:gliding motility-associated ABC transporter permease subunit GldF [Cytophagaceae bacterium ABcell3]|nr:gliding motility-associated ABC transporter permease subunit GldF [Cytophagaceae bacterium ABcell3]
MLSILQKEINAFLNSLIAYIVIILFLTAIGLFIWVFPETSIFEYGFAEMEAFFSLAPWVFIFLIPAITMRTFAEEKKDGTIELLLTRPVTDWQIIFGKYFSAIVLVCLALVPTLLYYYTVSELGSPAGNVDSAAVAGSYIGLILLGSVFASIGIMSSVLTTNQIVSFIIAVFLCFIFYTGFESLASVNVWGQYSVLIDKLGISYHYRALSKGLIDSRNLVYFFSVISIMLLSTKLILGSRKW